MRALSIRQPWAWLIIHGGKDIENRDRPTNVRGPVLIHASKGMTRDEYEEAAETAMEIGLNLPGLEPQFPSFEEMKRGGIIGIADIVDCVRGSDSPWFFGKWGFVLANVRALPFIPFKGMLGFFSVPDELIDSHLTAHRAPERTP